MLNWIYNILRLQIIAFVLIKHRALFPLAKLKFFRIFYTPFRILEFFPSSRSPGERLADAIYELGPIFIKIGQILSTRPDLIGRDLAADLAKLRDDLPSFDFSQAKAIIEDELGIELKQAFAAFEPKPIAAASIAQVHKGTTHDNRVVAIKILRPGIEKQFSKDLELLKWLVKLIDYAYKPMQKFKLQSFIDHIAEGIKIELDLRMEAAAASQMKEDMQNHSQIYIPQILWNHTTRRILTMEWIDAISIYDIKALKQAKYDLQKLAANFAIMFFYQAYEKGFYHADLHPGNVLIDTKGRIVLIDFGIMGRLDLKNRMFVAETLYGFLKHDYHKVADIHYKYGFVKQGKSKQLFAQACRAIGEPIIGMPVSEISIGKLLSQLLKVAEDFDMEIRHEIVSLQKTIMLVEAIGMTLDPEVNMWKLIEPWIEEWAIKNISIEAKILSCAKAIAKRIIHDLPEEIVKNHDKD
jgi:ubiquinone biosynthesis protein